MRAGSRGAIGAIAGVMFLAVLARMHAQPWYFGMTFDLGIVSLALLLAGCLIALVTGMIRAAPLDLTRLIGASVGLAVVLDLGVVLAVSVFSTTPLLVYRFQRHWLGALTPLAVDLALLAPLALFSYLVRNFWPVSRGWPVWPQTIFLRAADTFLLLLIACVHLLVFAPPVWRSG